MKPNRDTKFIIYQSLYVFVICVVTIKGADLTLDEVINKKFAWAYVDTMNNVVMDKKEFAHYIKLDTTNMVLLTRDDYYKIAGTDNPIPPPPISISGSGIYNQPPQPIDPTPDNPTNPESQNITYDFPSNLVQYKENLIKNRNNAEMLIKTSSGTISIPANSSRNILLKNESVVVFEVAGKPTTVSVKENQRPKILLQGITTGKGQEDVSLRRLQSTTGYRLTITDDFADQLEYKITGPVTYKESKRTDKEIVVDIYLNFLNSKPSFDNYTDTHSPSSNDAYVVSFNLEVRDKLAPHADKRFGDFRFTEW